MNILENGTGRARVRLTWQRWGNDLHVHVAGGEHHIGAAALVGRQAGGEACAGVLRVPPHKEDELALEAAKQLHAATGANVCVTAGIHVAGITRQELEAVLANVEAGVASLARRLQAL